MKNKLIYALICYILVFSTEVLAHGERAQQAGLRMRTFNWMDFNVTTTKLAVNEEIKLSGKFVPSIWWPEHMASPEGKAYLNVSSPGPAFVRINSQVNGVPTIRSQQYKLGETYEYEITLKARIPGRYHLHPILNVQDTGPVIGPGRWVEVTGDQDDFVNTVTTLTGKTIDLESVGLKEFLWLHAFWFIVAVAWIYYWFRKLPVVMPRFKIVQERGDEGGNELITMQDMVVSLGFFVFTLVAITVGYFIAQEQHPITTPLQTSTIEVPTIFELPDHLDIQLIEARYRIPGRSFKVELDITNKSNSTYQLGEFLTANIRFINKDVRPDIEPQDENDLIAKSGLVVEGGPIKPGQTTRIIMYADDALWETYRLTSLIYDPDSRFAAMLFFFDENGERVYYEVGGPMLPVFD